MLTGAAHDFLAHGGAAGEKDLVKMLVQQCQIFRAAAGDYTDIFGRKGFFQHGLDQCGGGRGIGTGLQDYRITRGQGSHQRR